MVWKHQACFKPLELHSETLINLIYRAKKTFNSKFIIYFIIIIRFDVYIVISSLITIQNLKVFNIKFEKIINFTFNSPKNSFTK